MRGRSGSESLLAPGTWTKRRRKSKSRIAFPMPRQPSKGSQRPECNPIRFVTIRRELRSLKKYREHSRNGSYVLVKTLPFSIGKIFGVSCAAYSPPHASNFYVGPFFEVENAPTAIAPTAINERKTKSSAGARPSADMRPPSP